ncbi:MAG TPA: caspase family protein, partial [Pyrinomonadaceae bacterium]
AEDAQTPAAGGARVFDLRLFRDGQLVAYAPAEGGEVKTDAATGKATITFDDIRLPRPRAANDEEKAGGRAGTVEFKAYAFNEDRVKSETARASFVPAQPLPPSKGRAYVVTVGVNAYENEAWDLRFAANDARRLRQTLAASLAAGGEYEEVLSVPLVSDYAAEGGRKTRPRVVKESSATKANFKAVLDLLAGRKVDEAAVRSIPGAERLRAATPEDLVIITFSSHGYADERGEFYLLPFDTGAAGGMREALSRSISSGELSLWLRDVDAGELVLVVDACHSAASVQGEGFKPGPMGSRGLGQLSYDKGMRVLTSTQADDVALEFKLVEMGLLTYALTREGVESARADRAPKDGRITVSEWLAYGVERVPALHADVEEKLAEMRAKGRAGEGARGVGGDEQARVVLGDGAGLSAADGARGIKVSGQPTRSQQPALFDFSRRRREALLSATR